MDEKVFTNNQVTALTTLQCFLSSFVVLTRFDQIEAFLADAVRLVKEAGDMIAEVKLFWSNF